MGFQTVEGKAADMKFRLSACIRLTHLISGVLGV